MQTPSPRILARSMPHVAMKFSMFEQMRSMHCGRSSSSNVKSFSSLMMLFCKSVIRKRMLSRPTFTPAK